MVHEGSKFEGGKTSDVLKGGFDGKNYKRTSIECGEVTTKDQQFLEGVSKNVVILQKNVWNMVSLMKLLLDFNINYS